MLPRMRFAGETIGESLRQRLPVLSGTIPPTHATVHMEGSHGLGKIPTLDSTTPLVS